MAPIAEGAAIGVGLWCIAFSFQLLPGITADTWGVILFAIGGAVLDIFLRRLLLLFAFTAVGVVLLVTQSSLSNVLAEWWVRSDDLPTKPVDAAVVLSAAVNQNNTMSSDALDGLLSGLQLVKEGRANVLVTTSVQERFPRSLVSSVADQSRIVSLVGSPPRWFRIAPTRSTREEAVKTAALLLPTGRRRIAVVTAPMHTRRACASFEAVGFSVTCTPTLSRAPGGADPAPWPTDRMHVFGEWVYEALATLKYRSAGWIRGG